MVNSLCDLLVTRRKSVVPAWSWCTRRHHMSATYCKLTARCGTPTGVTNSFPVTFVWITPTTTAISSTVRSPVNASDTQYTSLPEFPYHCYRRQRRTHWTPRWRVSRLLLTLVKVEQVLWSHLDSNKDLRELGLELIP